MNNNDKIGGGVVKAFNTQCDQSLGSGEVAGFAAGKVSWGQMDKRLERRMVPILMGDKILSRTVT